MAGLENAAEWIGAAKGGLAMQIGELTADQHRRVKDFKTIGAGHSDIGRKHQTVNVQPKAVLLAPERGLHGETHGALIVPQVLAAGRARPEQLPAGRAMHADQRQSDADQPW